MFHIKRNKEMKSFFLKKSYYRKLISIEYTWLTTKSLGLCGAASRWFWSALVLLLWKRKFDLDKNWPWASSKHKRIMNDRAASMMLLWNLFMMAQIFSFFFFFFFSLYILIFFSLSLNHCHCDLLLFLVYSRSAEVSDWVRSSAWWETIIQSSQIKKMLWFLQCWQPCNKHVSS